MKTNAFISRLTRFAGVFTLCCLLPTGLAYAQDTDEQGAASDAERERIAIIIEEDGRVIVNGKEVERDASGVLRFGNGGREVVVVRPGSPLHHFRLNESGAQESDVVEDLRYMTDKIRLESLPFERFEPLLGEAAFIARESAETIKLEREARQLARNARRAEGAERERLERELREKLLQTLDARLENRSERIQRLEEQLNEERETLEKRRNSRDEIVDRRLRELVGEDDVLDW